jgi:CRISPR-associated protein (TIGR02584 family)
MPLPDQYFRRVLLAISGMSPQILAETVYALARSVEKP